MLSLKDKMESDSTVGSSCGAFLPCRAAAGERTLAVAHLNGCQGSKEEASHAIPKTDREASSVVFERRSMFRGPLRIEIGSGRIFEPSHVVQRVDQFGCIASCSPLIVRSL